MGSNDGDKETSKKDLLSSSKEITITADDLKKHKKTIDLVNSRDERAEPDSEGLSGEELKKLIENKKNKNK